MTTITNLTLDGTSYKIAAGALEGIYESSAISAGSTSKRRWWSVAKTIKAREDLTIADIGSYLVGSGEMAYRTVYGRDVSPWDAGADFGLTIADSDFQVGTPGYTVSGVKGNVGQKVRAKVEASFSADGATWTDYEEFTEGYKEAKEIKVKVTLSRVNENWYVALAYLNVSATEADQIDHYDLLNIGTNTHAQIDAHIADNDKHREIDDTATGTTDLWSASKIDSELDDKKDWEFTLSGAGKEIFDIVGKDPQMSQTGALVINMGSVSLSDDITFDVGGYVDGDDLHWRAFIGGYVSWGSWYGLNAYVFGEPPFTVVQFGTNGSGDNVVVLGSTSDSWAYPSVFVRALNDSYGNNVSRSGWSLLWETDLSSYTLTSKGIKKTVYLDGSDSGWSGTFTNGDGDTVTVTNGIITGVA